LKDCKNSKIIHKKRTFYPASLFFIYVLVLLKNTYLMAFVYMTYFLSKIISILLATCIPFTVNARVFKCEINSKTSYQSAPCPNSDVGQIDLNVSRPTNKQIYEAQERLDNIYKEKEYEQRMRMAKKRQDALYNLEVQKSNAATKQADVTYDDAVAHRKEAAIEQRNMDLRSSKIRSVRERMDLRDEWDRKINAIE
jgi:ribosomal protein L20